MSKKVKYFDPELAQMGEPQNSIERQFLAVVQSHAEMGFGRMMQMISLEWYKNDPLGALQTGKCYGHRPIKVDFRPYMPQVIDQGDLGSSSACAVASTAEFHLKQRQKWQFKPSKLFQYYIERTLPLIVAITLSITVASAAEKVKGADAGFVKAGDGMGPFQTEPTEKQWVKIGKPGLYRVYATGPKDGLSVEVINEQPAPKKLDTI